MKRDLRYKPILTNFIIIPRLGLSVDIGSLVDPDSRGVKSATIYLLHENIEFIHCLITFSCFIPTNFWLFESNNIYEQRIRT